MDIIYLSENVSSHINNIPHKLKYIYILHSSVTAMVSVISRKYPVDIILSTYLTFFLGKISFNSATEKHW